MNEEADAICNAARYQRSPDRVVSEFLRTFVSDGLLFLH